MKDFELLTVEEAARLLRVSKDYVLRRVRDGSLSAHLLGHRYMIRKEGLESFLEGTAGLLVSDRKKARPEPRLEASEPSSGNEAECGGSPDEATLRMFLDAGSPLLAMRWWGEKNFAFCVDWHVPVDCRAKSAAKALSMIESRDELSAAIENGVEAFAFYPKRLGLTCFQSRLSYALGIEPFKGAEVWAELPCGQRVAFYDSRDKAARKFELDEGNQFIAEKGIFGGRNNRHAICPGSILDGKPFHARGDMKSLLERAASGAASLAAVQ